MINIIIFDATLERREGLIVAGKFTCSCGSEYLIMIDKEVRCKKCHMGLIFTKNGLVSNRIWKDKNGM